MRYFYIDPEVAGNSLGDRGIVDMSIHPPIVSRLHYEFDGWMGDALLESFPVFIVTEAAKRALTAGKVSGVSFDSVEVTKSEDFRQFEALEGRVILPNFAWLKPQGKPGEDDFGIGKDYRLVVSSRVLDILTPMGLAHADVEPFVG